MKKFLLPILCLAFCLAVAFIFPHLGESWVMVDDDGCLQCHEVGTFGANDGTIHGEHSECAACHGGGIGEEGNVASVGCINCHPFEGPGECQLVIFHDPDMGADCLICHPDCSAASTTTTTAVSSTTTSATDLCPSEELYGEDSEEVEILRYLRDNVLSATPEGQEIIKLYYQWAPVITIAIQNDEEVKAEIKAMVDGILMLITE